MHTQGHLQPVNQVSTHTTILELALGQEIQQYIISEKAPVEPKGFFEEVLTFDTLRQMMIPLVIIFVVLYQYFFKASKNKSS